MPSFLNHEKPLVTAMITRSEPRMIKEDIRNCMYDGADAFGIQVAPIKNEFRTDEMYRSVFSGCAGKPTYITSYRHGYNKGFTDEECVEALIQALRCGGTLGDLMGDLYDPSPMEITKNPEAIKRQMETIDRIHDMGKEVLISSHTKAFLPTDRVVELALEYERRGADVVKIVTEARSEDEQMENLNTAYRLKKELKTPFLFLANGTHYKLLRIVGPMLGCCMYLGVREYNSVNGLNQPMVSALRYLVDHFEVTPDMWMV